MSQVTEFLSRSFSFNVKTVRMTTEGFRAEDWSRVPAAEGGNTAHWIFGHIVAARRGLARKLGGDVPELEWEATFDMNAKPESTDGYPTPEELTRDFETTDAVLSKLLGSLTDEQASSEWGAFPDGGKTLLDGAQFFFFHESYHLGQLGLIRRMGGKPGFA